MLCCAAELAGRTSKDHGPSSDEVLHPTSGIRRPDEARTLHPPATMEGPPFSKFSETAAPTHPVRTLGVKSHPCRVDSACSTSVTPDLRCRGCRMEQEIEHG